MGRRGMKVNSAVRWQLKLLFEWQSTWFIYYNFKPRQGFVLNSRSLLFYLTETLKVTFFNTNLFEQTNNDKPFKMKNPWNLVHPPCYFPCNVNRMLDIQIHQFPEQWMLDSQMIPNPTLDVKISTTTKVVMNHSVNYHIFRICRSRLPSDFPTHLLNRWNSRNILIGRLKMYISSQRLLFQLSLHLSSAVHKMVYLSWILWQMDWSVAIKTASN